jgi:type I restriction enzyme S subunit
MAKAAVAQAPTIDGPWELPEGWEWVRLGDAFSIRSGTLEPAKKPNEKFCLYSIPAYDAGIGPEIHYGREIGSAKIVVQKGDLLLSKLNPRIPRVWSIDEDTPHSKLASTEFLPLIDRVTEGVPYFDTDFVKILLLSDAFRNQVAHDVQGATGSRQRLKREIVLSAILPRPRSLQTQRRIVARIEALMAEVKKARTLLEQMRRDADRLMDATLKETFPESERDLPQGWHLSTIEELEPSDRLSVQTGPFGAQLKSEEFVDTGVPVVAIGNVQWGKLDANRLNYVTPAKARQLSRYRLQAGDILFTRMGTVGRSCVVPPFADGWLMTYHLIRVSVDPEKAMPEFVFYCFRGAKTVADQIHEKGRGATREGVNSQILRELRLPLPQLTKQKQIVVHLNSIQSEVDQMQQLFDQDAKLLDQLEQSILERAFRGEL